MRASVIIVTYNSVPHIRRCLDSVVAQVRQDDEIIVIDNGSTDGSAKLIETSYPWIRLVRSHNSGYAGGNNRGASEARGRILVFLNPDTVPHPGALDALLAPVDAPGDIGLSTACVVYMNRPNIINTCGNTIHYTGLTYRRGAGQDRAGLNKGAEVHAVSGAAFAIRREVFEELGGFDEHFFMYVEDTDLSWRARLLGYRCVYVPGAIVEHDYHPSYSPRKAFHLDYNRHVMLLKNLGRATYVRMLPGLLLAELLTWGFLIMKGPRFWAVKLCVYRELWERRGLIQRMHRRVAQQRRRSDAEVMRGMEYRLEFDQLAGRLVSRLAALVFHPAFWAARLFVGRG